jgi:hypothetical protein
MLMVRGLVLVLALVVTGSPQAMEDAAPNLSNDPLTVDQIAIYRTFLAYFAVGSTPLHLINRTAALPLPDPSDSEDDDPEIDPCLKGLKLVNQKEAATIVHMLDRSLAIKGRVVLVDPDSQQGQIKANDLSKTMEQGKTAEEAAKRASSTGLMALSEVLFDRRHRVALMIASFSCGHTCGFVAVFRFKKTRQQWKMFKEPCAGGVS